MTAFQSEGTSRFLIIDDLILGMNINNTPDTIIPKTRFSHIDNVSNLPTHLTYSTRLAHLPTLKHCQNLLPLAFFFYYRHGRIGGTRRG
jgi:hypothetical protein